MSAEPVTEIGADHGQQTQFLFGIRGLERLGDGTIVVANGSTSELRFFDSRGTFIRASGGRGGGPAEFLSLLGLYRCAADTLVVRDRWRLSVWDAKGRFVRSVPMTPRGDGRIRELQSVSADCRSLLMLERDPSAAPNERISRQPYALYWASMDGRVQDTVARFTGPERALVTYSGRSLRPPLPWGTAPVFAAAGSTVVLALGDRPELRVIDERGEIQRIVRWRSERRPVGASDRAMFSQRRQQFLRDNPQEAIVFPPLDHFPIPDQKPLYSAVLVDSEGHLWLRGYPDAEAGYPEVFGPAPRGDPVAWSVFDRAGRLLGAVDVPAALGVRQIVSDAIVGVWRDDDDVERVRVYRLNRQSR